MAVSDRTQYGSLTRSAGLPLEQREAIVLKFYQGFKLAEIAEIQGCPLSTAKTRVYSGFEQLRKFIVG
jgi:RNA polymerase sigma-70 factor (ECF subfamily)